MKTRKNLSGKFFVPKKSRGFFREIKFLLDLKKEGKLELVEPSEEITDSYLKKSDSNLESAKILLNSDKLEESVSLAYYSMYHCLVALLFKCGIKCENHGGSIILLKELFQESELAEKISFAKKERVDKQYYVDFSVTEEDVEDLIKSAEDFISSCKIIQKRLTIDEIDRLRRELEKSLKSILGKKMNKRSKKAKQAKTAEQIKQDYNKGLARLGKGIEDE